MAQNVIRYDLLISCPGDVSDEIEMINYAVEKFNQLYSDVLGITIRTRHWKKSSYAQSGGKPQVLLNEQFVDDCDAAVAIFWTRFGTPTDEYGSGTEEEIENMLDSGKQVFMYFSDKPVPPSQSNAEEYKKVQDFRDKYKSRGIYYSYSSNDEFSELFFAHLSQYFLSEKRVNEISNDIIPKLRLVGIDKNGKLSDEASIYPFVLNAEMTKAQYCEKIRNKYHEIEAIKPGKRIENTNRHLSSFNFLTPVEIEKDEKELIIEASKCFGVDISDCFFDLGNLSKDSFTSNPFNGLNLKGTDNEKNKYKKIKNLHLLISQAIDWAYVEDAFSNKHCIKLAVKNEGKAVDEDIEVSFELPKCSFLTLDDFPKLKNDEMDYLLHDCSINTLFGIDSTFEFLEYSESVKSTIPTYTPRSYGLPGIYHDYSNEFKDKLDSVFCYSVFSNEDKYIISLKMDYIKHNTTIAFPTIIFLKDSVSEIPYKITSKNNPEIVNGILRVQNLIT